MLFEYSYDQGLPVLDAKLHRSPPFGRKIKKNVYMYTQILANLRLRLLLNVLNKNSEVFSKQKKKYLEIKQDFRKSEEIKCLLTAANLLAQ